MNRAPLPCAWIDLPAVADRSALRAALMAMRVPPEPLPADPRARIDLLRELHARPATIAFVDIAEGGTPIALLELDRALPRDDSRGRIFLTRLGGGHVSEADRRWVRSLGFADLVPEFAAENPEGLLRETLDAVAGKLGLATLAPVDLARYCKAMNDRRDALSPRAIIRALSGLDAEACAALLHQSLPIQDRSYRMLSYARCFVGTEAVGWIAARWRRSRTEAVALGQALCALGLLAHVVQEHPFLDEPLFYRLACADGGHELDLGRVFEGLHSAGGVPVAARAYRATTYGDCWIGSEAVSWVVARHAVTRLDAWLALHRLMQFKLFEHVTRARPFIDGHFFYRFAARPDKAH